MMNTNDPYLAYYRRQQLQTGGSIEKVFRGAAYQRGHGIGSFLGGMFRTIAPILKSGAKTVAKEALKSSAGFLGDLVTRGPKEAATHHFNQFTGSLKRKADDKLDRVLRGGGGGGPGAKNRRVTPARKRATHKNTEKLVMSGGRRVTPQSLAKLLRGRTSPKKKRRSGSSKKTKRRRTVGRKKAVKRTSVRDIFN